MEKEEAVSWLVAEQGLVCKLAVVVVKPQLRGLAGNFQMPRLGAEALFG